MPLFNPVPATTQPPFRPAQWYNFPNAAAGSTAVVANGEARYAPAFFPQPTTFTAIGAETTAIGSTGTSFVRFGIYRDGGGFPASLVTDFGTVLSDVLGLRSITATFTFQPGWWWLVAVPQGAPATNPTWRTAPGMHGGVHLGSTGTGASAIAMTQASVTAALPATATPVGSGAAAAIAFRLRTAA